MVLRVFDVGLDSAECTNKVAELSACSCIYVGERNAVVKHVVKDIVHKFFLFRCWLTRDCVIRKVDSSGGM